MLPFNFFGSNIGHDGRGPPVVIGSGAAVGFIQSFLAEDASRSYPFLFWSWCVVVVVESSNVVLYVVVAVDALNSVCYVVVASQSFLSVASFP